MKNILKGFFLIKSKAACNSANLGLGEGVFSVNKDDRSVDPSPAFWELGGDAQSML